MIQRTRDSVSAHQNTRLAWTIRPYSSWNHKVIHCRTLPVCELSALFPSLTHIDIEIEDEQLERVYSECHIQSRQVLDIEQTSFYRFISTRPISESNKSPSGQTATVLRCFMLLLVWSGYASDQRMVDNFSKTQTLS